MTFNQLSTFDSTFEAILMAPRTLKFIDQNVESMIRGQAQLLHIDQISLNIIEFKFKKAEDSAAIDKRNVIEKKRTRKPNLKYANMAIDNEDKFSFSHAGFNSAYMIDIAQINQQSFKSHQNILFETSFH